MTQLKRRREPTGCTTYLIEVCFPTGHVAAAHVRVETSLDGAITNAFVIDDDIETLHQLLAASNRSKASAYRTINASTAAKDLIVGMGRHHIARPSQAPANPWPDNEPLVAWVLRLVLREADDSTLRGGKAA